MSKIHFAADSTFIDDEPSTGMLGRSPDKRGGNKPPPVAAGVADVGRIAALCMSGITGPQGMSGIAGRGIGALGSSEDSQCSKDSNDSKDSWRCVVAVG